MLKKNDVCIVKRDDACHFYKGAKVVVMNDPEKITSDNKRVYVRNYYGYTTSWCAEEDLELV